MADRIGPREPYNEGDARHRIDRLAHSTALEEESSVGLACFGPRIREEPFPKGFSLPHDSPKYTGATKPEDRLTDYTTAVGIAGGNRVWPSATFPSCCSVRPRRGLTASEPAA